MVPTAETGARNQIPKNPPGERVVARGDSGYIARASFQISGTASETTTLQGVTSTIRTERSSTGCRTWARTENSGVWSCVRNRDAGFEQSWPRDSQYSGSWENINGLDSSRGSVHVCYLRISTLLNVGCTPR